MVEKNAKKNKVNILFHIQNSMLMKKIIMIDLKEIVLKEWHSTCSIFQDVVEYKFGSNEKEPIMN